MKNLLALLIALSFPLSITSAQTYIADKQEVYGLWTLAKSPYIVRGEAIVPKGKTLTIEAGVTVKFKTGKNYDYDEPGFDVGFLRVDGRINAQGTANRWITFTRLGGVRHWGCVLVDKQETELTIAYCRFEYGNKVSYSRLGKVGYDSSPGVLSVYFTNFKIQNCIFYKNSHWGFYSNRSTSIVSNSSFIDNPHQNIYTTTASLEVRNSIFTGFLSSANGIAGGQTSFEYCLVEGKLDEVTTSNNIIYNQDPLFKDIANGDFSLQANSPCIGAGKDGEDIGAIPYKRPFQANLSSKAQSDKTPPQIKISSIYNNYQTQSKHISIRGKATDKSGIFQVLVNNTVASLLSDGTFSTTLELKNQGNNTINIQATDNSLNTQTTTLNVILQAQEAVYKKRLALVIGNADYQQNTGDLRNPVNDARDMKAKLESMHFEVMAFEDLTYPEMRRAISQYGKQLKDYDVGLIYYSGHGIASHGRNYLIPTDATLNFEEAIPGECIDQNLLLGQMEGAGSAVNIVILDACRNNPFTKSWSKGMTETEWVNVTSPRGTFIAYATSPEKVAHDGWEDNGAYTAELLKYIDEPGLTIEQVFKKVRSALEYKFLNLRLKQLPWESTSLKGDFYFVK